jgi:Tol biopolymer transport system component
MLSRVNRFSILLLWALPSAIAGSACSDDSNRFDGVNNPADLPVLVVHNVDTDQGVPVDIHVLDGASDPGGAPLRVTRASAPGHRVDILAGGVLRVNPRPDFNGKLFVDYDVSDGSHVVTKRSTVTVHPVNHAPVATGGTMNVTRSNMFILAASDVDGDALTYEIVTPPAHGTLSGTPPALTYTASLDFAGEDIIAFRASDGKASSAVATFRLEVSASPPPVAFPDSLFTSEDQSLHFVLVANDGFGDPLTYTIVTPPAHGTLGGTAPNLIYTPAHDFNGADALVFSVSDGVRSSSQATVSIQVARVNDAPVATSQMLATNEDTPVAITMTARDVDGDFLGFVVQGGPSHGTLSGFGPTRTYTPVANYHGPDSFTFVATDSVATSALATVTIDVVSVEDPPIAASFSVSLNEDTTAAITLQGSDGDGDPISYTIATQPAHGTLSGTAPALTYTPVANFNGQDSFTYTVSSGGVISPPGTVTLQVAPVNDAPVALADTVTTDEDTPVAITLQASDIDGQTLTFSIVTPPADGTLTGGPGPGWTYTPAANVSGARSFTFRASDGALSATAVVGITINPVNDPPRTVDDFVLTDPATPITIDVVANDSDAEGDVITLASAEPAHGTAEVVEGELLYTPAAGFTGTDVFVYTVVDSHGAASTGNVHVGVGTWPAGAPTERIAAVGGNPSSDPRRAPSISEDGRYIVFSSALPLVGDDTNGFEDVYLYDRGTRTTTRVSVATGGAQSNGDSFRAHVSASGRYIVFESVATNLVAGDSNGVSDVFRHDRVTGETLRVSVASDGAQAGGASLDATISDDGNLVAFASAAFNLIASDANGAADVFVRDVTAGTTMRASITATGGEGDFASTEPVISGDGRFVAFSSLSTNMVAGDTNNVADVFLRDRVAGTTTRVSVSSVGGEANRASLGPSLSRDGRFISFRSDATNLVTGAPVAIQLYVRDAQGQTTTRPLNSSVAIQWGRLSSDGRYVAQYSFAGVTIRDRFTPATAVPANSAALSWPVFSGNGRYVSVLELGSVTNVTVLPNPL